MVISAMYSASDLKKGMVGAAEAAARLEELSDQLDHLKQGLRTAAGGPNSGRWQAQQIPQGADVAVEQHT